PGSAKPAAKLQQLTRDNYGICAILDSGSMEILAAPQPISKPLIVATPHGRATIVGTRFSLEVASNYTKLEVIDGKVKMDSAVADESVVVEKGESATVAR